MKVRSYLSIIFLCFAAAAARSQSIVPDVPVPKVQDIETIDTTNNKFRFGTSASILRMLPHLTAKETGPFKPPEEQSKYQFGTITLKDGRMLKWRSSHFGNIYLTDGVNGTFYVEEVSFWAFSMGQFVYAFAVFAIFSAFVTFFFNKRRELRFAGSSGVQNDRRDRRRTIAIRVAASLALLVLAFLLFQEPVRQIRDGVAEMHGKGSRSTSLVFADTEPGSFWFSMFLNSFFAILALLFGSLCLINDPGGRFWSGGRTDRPKPTFL